MKVKNRIKYGLVIVMMCAALLLLIILSAAVGKVNLFTIEKSIAENIFINVRFPRIVLGMVTGAALAVSGTVLQSLLNNPLADSYTLAISPGAALGACTAIYLNTIFPIYIPISIMSIVFSIVVLFIVIWIADSRGSMSTSNLVLAGIIVSTICQSGVSFLKSLANENAVAMVYWLMGNLASKDMRQALVLTVVVAIGVGICLRYSKEINIMTLGRREALLVGVNYDKINKLLLIVCAIMTGACVSLCGIIGFVGLVVPHLVRILVGADNKKIIPVSSLLGAILLLSADTLTRTVLMHELPVGVITTMIGGPFFCYIFVNKNKGM